MPNQKLAQPVRARQVLDAVYGNLSGFLDVRVLPSAQRTFVPIGDHEALEAYVKPRRLRRNLYVGVAVRRSSADGTVQNCGALPALFADLDFKDFPDESSARASLADAPLPPSLVVQSGGGLQVWWLLGEPLDLAEPMNVAAAKTLLRGLAVALRADVRSAEPAHILRLPNTLNFKYDPPRWVQVEVFEPARRYALADFDWLPEEASPVSAPPPPRVVRPTTGVSARARGRKYLAPIPRPEIGCGSDAAVLYAACRLVLGFDLSPADAEDLLWEWAGGRPGWSRSWIADKVRNAVRYGTEDVGALL